MRHCIETLLSAGEQAEIILVDDGSVKDETPAICDEYAAKYPTIVKAIHQMCIRDRTMPALSPSRSTRSSSSLGFWLGRARRVSK